MYILPVKIDAFVNPAKDGTALCFILLSLRRTLSTHPAGTALADDIKFARHESCLAQAGLLCHFNFLQVSQYLNQANYLFTDNLRNNDKKKPIMISAPARLMLQAK